MMAPRIRFWIVGGVFLLALSPLVFVPAVIFPAVAGRGLFVLAVASVMFALGAAALLRDRAAFPKNIPLVGYFLAMYALWMTVTALLGVHPAESFAPSYERMDGVLILLALVVIFAAFLLPVFSGRTWARLLAVMFYVNAAVVLFLVAQTGMEFPHPYLTAFFGNPAIVASYLVPQPFLAWFAIRTGVSKRVTYALMALSLLDVALIGLSGVRGAMIALVAGIATLGIGQVLVGGAFKARKLFRAGIIGLVVLGGVFIFVLLTAPGVEERPLRDLVAAPLDTFSKEPRTLLWNIGIKGIAERPFLGWGYQSFDAVFEKYYDPLWSLQESWSDSTHNTYLDVLVAGGIPALTLYVAVFVAGLMSLLSVPREEKGSGDAQSRMWPEVFLAAATVAYLVNNFFIFPTIAPTLLIVGVLGYGASRHIEWVRGTVPWRYRVLGLALVSSVAVIGASISFSSLYAGGLVAGVNASQDSESPRIRALHSALTLPVFDRGGLSMAIAEFTGDLPVDQDSLAAIKGKGEARLNRPGSSRYLFSMGGFFVAQKDQETARTFLESARSLAPNHTGVRRALGALYIERGEYPEALQEYKIVFENMSRFPHTSEFQFYIDQAREEYAAALVYAGLAGEAAELLAERYGPGVIFHSPALLRAYDAVGNGGQVLRYLKTAQAQEPDNPQHCFSLAAAELKFENSARSIRTLQECAKRFPERGDEARKFIQNIRSGTIDRNAL